MGPYWVPFGYIYWYALSPWAKYCVLVKLDMNPLEKVKIKWSPEFAYAIGLIATDGNLSSDGRHIDFSSKDLEQVENFIKALKTNFKIRKKPSGSSDNLCYRVQFGDMDFYNFLVKIGITPKKSKTIGVVKIPQKYFFDFLRGHFDGDGTFYSYWDKRWKSSFMFYTEFISASKKHIDWLREEITDRLGIRGHITKSVNNSVYQLKYAKGESLKVLRKIYYKSDCMCLSRKRLKIEKVLAIIGETL
jgi:intein-encoded DNA endonuclease-like protein